MKNTKNTNTKDSNTKDTNRSPPGSVPPGVGTRLVLAMVGLAAALAGFAIWFQWRQTHRCLDFYGPTVARAIQTAARVEVWNLRASGDRVQAVGRRDVSRAAGLVHLRHGLVEDANFAWQREPPGENRLPAAAWDRGLAFFATGGTEPAAILAIDTADDGWLTVVGKPGRIGLGRIGRGLRTWLSGLAATGADAGGGGGF